MARYDYSLDVGQSIETDEKIKELEKEQPQGCCKAPAEKEAGDEKVEEEQLENVPEEEKKEPEKKEEKVEIKPISFEKAKLISDFEQEKPKEEEGAPEEKEPEEDEQDVNEFLEESFNKETKEYEEIKNKKNNKEIIIEEPSNKKMWIITAIIIIIAICASVFGYFYFKEPVEPTGAVVTPETINLTQIMQENTTNETVVEQIVEEKNVSAEAALEDFISALKD